MASESSEARIEGFHTWQLDSSKRAETDTSSLQRR